jgi:hypothetical protein
MRVWGGGYVKLSLMAAQLKQPDIKAHNFYTFMLGDSDNDIHLMPEERNYIQCTASFCFAESLLFT